MVDIQSDTHTVNEYGVSGRTRERERETAHTFSVVIVLYA